MHFARRDLARNDFAENTVGVGHGLIELNKGVQSFTGRCPFKRTMPSTMRYKNQMETATQANHPGKNINNHKGAVIKYSKAAQITVRMR
jgi:hypothetical protein